MIVITEMAQAGTSSRGVPRLVLLDLSQLVETGETRNPSGLVIASLFVPRYVLSTSDSEGLRFVSREGNPKLTRLFLLLL